MIINYIVYGAAGLFIAVGVIGGFLIITGVGKDECDAVESLKNRLKWGGANLGRKINNGK